MFKVLMSCCICATMLIGGNMEVKSVQQYLVDSNQAYVIIDNKYNKVDNLDGLNNMLNDMLQDSRTMPAFGVSIHTETLNAIKNGVWLKLQYNGTQNVDDMPFDELLIEINPEFSGFNIIRGNKGIYDGRCFYIDLEDKTMKSLYDFVTLNYINK